MLKIVIPREEYSLFKTLNLYLVLVELRQINYQLLFSAFLHSSIQEIMAATGGGTIGGNITGCGTSGCGTTCGGTMGGNITGSVTTGCGTSGYLTNGGSTTNNITNGCGTIWVTKLVVTQLLVVPGQGTIGGDIAGGRMATIVLGDSNTTYNIKRDEGQKCSASNRRFLSYRKLSHQKMWKNFARDPLVPSDVV